SGVAQRGYEGAARSGSLDYSSRRMSPLPPFPFQPLAKVAAQFQKRDQSSCAQGQPKSQHGFSEQPACGLETADDGREKRAHFHCRRLLTPRFLWTRFCKKDSLDRFSRASPFNSCPTCFSLSVLRRLVPLKFRLILPML